MAKQMSFKSADGVTHEASYWIPVQINLNKMSKTGQVTFLGYHDKQSRDDVLATVGCKSFTVKPENYDVVYLAENVVKGAYALIDFFAESDEFFTGATNV